jgi:hypothetical protein
MLDGIARLAVHAGAPKKFHYTATVAWVRLVAAAVAQEPSEIPFEEWLIGFPELSKKDLLSFYFSAEKLRSEEARLSWIEPDLRLLK